MRKGESWCTGGDEDGSKELICFVTLTVTLETNCSMKSGDNALAVVGTPGTELELGTSTGVCLLDRHCGVETRASRSCEEGRLAC